MGAIAGGIIGGIILLLFIAIPLCICCCMYVVKKSSYNKSIGLASTQTQTDALGAETNLVSDGYISENTNITSAYPAAGYIQQPLPAIDQPLGPPPTYPATGYVLVDNPAPYLPQQPLMVHPTAQMGYPPVGYPVQGYGYPAPVGYPVQSYGYPQVEGPSTDNESEYDYI